MAVAWGRDHVDLTGIRAIGIDEIHWQRGSQFLTLVYQIDLPWIGQHRKTLLRFLGRERTAALAFTATCDLKVVAKNAGMPSTSWTGFTSLSTGSGPFAP